MATFHLFPRLPFDLRALIWHSTVEPRTVEIRVEGHWDRHHSDRYDFPLTSGPLRLVSPKPVPATLQTCREARYLRLYQQAFAELSADTGAGPPVAPLVRRLKYERALVPRNPFLSEVRELHDFVNLEQVFVDIDDMHAFYGVWDHDWLVGFDNVFWVHPELVYQYRARKCEILDPFGQFVLLGIRSRFDWIVAGFDVPHESTRLIVQPSPDWQPVVSKAARDGRHRHLPTPLEAGLCTLW
ncbi:hypothetical protein VTI74DRAFT_6667 [Chaetomium olivicolor]